MSQVLRKLCFHLIILAFAAVLLYPLLWMISASFMTNQEIFTGEHFLPQNPSLDNFRSGWSGVSGFGFYRFFLNSFFIAGVGIIANVITCSMAAFAFAKLTFKGRTVMFTMVLMTLMLPMHVRLIPTYIIFNNLGWVNTFLPLTVPRFFAVESFFIFLLVQFMRNISNELLEAPRIDGANTFRIYIHFVLPLSLPALVTVSIFTFIWTWNDFFQQLIYLSNPALFTVALALRMFVDATGRSTWGALFAMSCLSLIPLFVVFIGFQKYLIEGITTGSLKG